MVTFEALQDDDGKWYVNRYAKDRGHDTRRETIAMGLAEGEAFVLAYLMNKGGL